MTYRITKTDVWNSLALDLIGIQVEGKLVFINTAGATLLGATCPEQLIGKSLLDFVHPDYRDTAKAKVWQMLKEGVDASPCKEKWVRLDGTEIEVEVVVTPLIYKNRLAFQFIAQDITEYKHSAGE